MTVQPVDRFVILIRERTGNVVPPARRGFLTEVLERRSRAVGAASPHAYLDRLEGRGPDADAEWAALVPLVTIKESYFFRAPQQFAALERHLLPLLVAARQEGRRLRAWSVACARGEEPGTLAILFAESELLRGWDWEIVGTDVDGEALETARRGLYGERAVAHVPPAQLGRWFEPRGKLYELAPALRERISYRSLNLAHPPYDLLRESPGRTFDVVLLRNVLIYFRRPLQRRVVAAVADALAPNGALFLGASETLWQIQDRLAPHDLGNCFCYLHRDPDEPQEPLRRLAARLGPGSHAGRGPRPAAAEDESLTFGLRWSSREAAAEGDAGDAAAHAGDTAARGPVDVPWLDPRPRRYRIGAEEAATTDPAGDKAAAEEEGSAGAAGRSGSEAATATRGTNPADAGGEAGATADPPASGGERTAGAAEIPLADLLAAQADDDASHIHAGPCGIQERLVQVARRLADNRLDEARRELEEVLEADPSEAAAHALDGFLHDLRGEMDDAISSYRAALYLDPALYQVRLLLADNMNRQGLRQRAEHEYRQVLAALSAGRDRVLPPFEVLPVPDRDGARRRCRRALGRR